MNSVVLVGNIARDPELRKTSSGLSTCQLTVVVSRPKNKEGVAEADFIPVVTWRTQAENCAKYLTKGKKVAVQGEIRVRSYEKDGHKVYVTEVLANNVEFLSPRGQQGSSTNEAAQEEKTDANGYVQVSEEELPF